MNLSCTLQVQRNPLNEPFMHIVGPKRPIGLMNAQTFPVCCGSKESHGVNDLNELSLYVEDPKRPMMFYDIKTFTGVFMDKS